MSKAVMFIGCLKYERLKHLPTLLNILSRFIGCLKYERLKLTFNNHLIICMFIGCLKYERLKPKPTKLRI